MPFSSGGPREDGGFKPNITAPGAAISTTPMWLPGTPVAEAGYEPAAGLLDAAGNVHGVPAGNRCHGTAPLGSQAGGRGEHVRPLPCVAPCTPLAVWNPTIRAYLQGLGQIDVPSARGTCSRRTSRPASSPRRHRSAPRCGTCSVGRPAQASTSGARRTPAVRRPTRPSAYDVTLTRTTGKAKSGTYALSFKGNDGTFSVSPSSVSLPLNSPVTVKVTATPAAGGHSATMLIDDPKTKGLDGSMMAVVVAGEVVHRSAIHDHQLWRQQAERRADASS